ncbi:MAG: hypothetical protein ACRD63_17250, partial [Pyrinomonadaceae bacterium]
MSILKKVHKRFLVWVALVLMPIRMPVAWAWSSVKPNDTTKQAAVTNIRQGLMLRIALPTKSAKLRQRRYALEVAGTFPY